MTHGPVLVRGPGVGDLCVRRHCRCLTQMMYEIHVIWKFTLVNEQKYTLLENTLKYGI